MELTKARILHISKYYYPFLGGTEQVARDMVRALLGTGAEQKVICFNEDAGEGDNATRHGETVTDWVDGVEVVRCGYQLKAASQSVALGYSRELQKQMDLFRPNVVVLHYPNPYVTHFLLKYRDRDFKLLVYWHLDITKQKVLKHLFYRQNLDLIRRADWILGATPKHVDESAFSAQFGEKKYVLSYMINEESLVLSEEEKERSRKIRKKYQGKALAFFIGRHVFYKGITYLVQASKELGDLNVQFLIAGSGELTEALKKEAYGDRKIEFLGRISEPERRAYLDAADIVCFPSVTRSEGFGLALAEGMYFGHPAVTFTIPGSGVNYVNLDGVTGIECPNGDVKAYARALEKLCKDEKLRASYGAAARERIQNNFSSERFKENVIHLIQRL